LGKKKVTDHIREWMDVFGKENGYELSRSEFVKESGAWYLRVYVDKLTADGYESMSTDDCEIISRHLSEKLDLEDPVKQNYYLEVSSPGLDRLLVSEKDFQRFTGSLVDINLYQPLEGKKSLQGQLTAYSEETITILDDHKNEKTIPKEQISKMQLAIVF
jgi:ribosome maturation factor RimP